MEVITTIKEIKNKINEFKRNNETIGFVPTMGYLHEGHKSLIDRARIENTKIIVSIFVNPIQFGENEDLSTYPRNLEGDSDICKNSGVDILFAPTVQEMYPNGFSSFVEVTGITDCLCGKSRPSHFRGVTTVVMKLLNITSCTKAYLGEKDFQQYKVIEKMVKDLNIDTTLVPCPIYREDDGLAKSSRNSYLNSEERISALCLSKALKKAKIELDKNKDAKSIIEIIKNEISKEPLAKIDYIEIVSQDTLKPITTIKENVLIAIAVFIGKTRLIDNLLYNIK
ncbi:pantoate--beta-alanine ligase [Clostridium cylindrosporum]|uniref:Pantothenate synthetase n=1 Tax=Clostridium cylindrosporum DSM 605 TaxID=1121307 RepID=A0A0J8D406_CLOCY|nr:pantoate--beta-alanine ligase [Clostridium cylindrosporum]KMT20910.1 pantothenate synthetase PanC [Clostridium cylindrosporum DSM 605]